MREHSTLIGRGSLRFGPSGSPKLIFAIMRSFVSNARPKVGLWQGRDFLNLWAARAISEFGSRITRTALPIIAILTTNASTTQLGVLSALSIGPSVLVGLTLGGWIDRSSKRNVLIGTDLIRAFLLLTIPVAAWMKILTIGQLYLVAAMVGAFSVIFQIADHAFLPALIGHERIVDGNSKLQATDAIAEVGGPSLTGVLVYLASAPGAILFDAISFLVSATLLASIEKTEALTRGAAQNLAPGRDFVIGLRAGLGNRLVRPLFLQEANSALFGGFFATLYMVFVLKTLGLSAALAGLLIGLGGIGGFLGTAVARWADSRLAAGRAIIVSLVIGQFAGLLIPLAHGRGWPAISLLAAQQVIGDGAMVAFSIWATSLRQTVIPQDEIGRAAATLQAITGILTLVGALLAGWLATQIGIRATIWIGVIGGMPQPLIVLLSPIHALDQMPVSKMHELTIS